MSDFLKELYQWSTNQLASPISASANPALSASATFYDEMPSADDDPVNVICFYEFGGFTDPHVPLSIDIIRVVSRGTDRDAAKSLIDQIYTLLHAAEGSVLIEQDILDFHVHTLVARSRPQRAGNDQNNYPLFAFNIDARIRKVS